MAAFGNGSGFGMWDQSQYQGGIAGSVPFEMNTQNFPSLGGNFPAVFQGNLNNNAEDLS